MFCEIKMIFNKRKRERECEGCGCMCDANKANGDSSFHIKYIVHKIKYTYMALLNNLPRTENLISEASAYLRV